MWPTVPYKRDDFVTAVIRKNVETHTDRLYKPESSLSSILPQRGQLITISKVMRPSRRVMALSHLSPNLHPGFIHLGLEINTTLMQIRCYCLYSFHIPRELRRLIQTIPTHTTFHIPQMAGYENKRYDALWGNCLSAVEQSSRILAESHESPLCNCKDTNKRVKNKIKIIFIFSSEREYLIQRYE